MSVAAIRERLAACRIYNSHGFFRQAVPPVYISYTARGDARSMQTPSWQVIGVDFQSDPQAAWYNHDCKTFGVWGRVDRAAKLAEAQAWATATYGIATWACDPWGAYGDADRDAVVSTFADRQDEDRDAAPEDIN